MAGVSGDGVSDSVACGALFAVSVDLTEAGVARWAEVVGCVLAHARACLRELCDDAARRRTSSSVMIERVGPGPRWCQCSNFIAFLLACIGVRLTG